VSRSLNVWRLDHRTAARVVPRLRAAGAVELTERDRRLVPFVRAAYSDPLVPQEWWMPVIGVDRLTPPGPGVPVTVLDFGLDLSHPEFAGRPNTFPLNNQLIESSDDAHGTAVSSVVGAPANGIGLVGVYPQAVLREWDFHDAELSDVLAGFDAASRVRGVINISGGFFGREPLLERAVDRAYQRGSLVVAAAGNDRQAGSRAITPANLPHVLTVAATNRSRVVAFFSSRGRTNDLAAPGQEIPVAVPTVFSTTGYDVYDGTSFSSPMVAGAAAWVWTARPGIDNTQLFDLMRFSAQDVAPAGRDADTGYGILNVPDALARTLPPPDPQEPNEDVYLVKPRGLTPAGHAPLTAPGRGTVTVRARLDAYEDPADVYRVWLPAHRRLVVRTKGNHDVNVALWSVRTRSVRERGRLRRRDRLRVSVRRGTRADFVSLASRSRRGAYVYAVVTPGRGTLTAAYSLSVATARR
jgi:hypothetical protein